MWWMLWSCTSPTTPGTPDTGVDTPLDEIPETSSIAVPHMDGDAWIVRTTAGIPYIYASTREDLARATGYALGVDRFFMIDMERRLAEGRIAEVLGDSALAADLEARGIGMSRVTDQLLLRMQHDTAFAGVFDAYAEGLNAYVSEVNANRLPVPSEYAQLGPLIGHPDPKTLLAPFTRRDMAAIGATLIYQLGFEDEDLTRAESWAALDGLFAGATQGDLRQAGAEQDLFWRVEPVWDVSSAPGFGTAGLRSTPTPARTPARGPLRVERQTLARLTEHTSHVIRWFGKDRAFGSNAWAVDGAHTTDGRAILSGDGHLPLSVPSLFYQVGLDTSVLGDGEISQVGLAIPGLPMMAVGTNGRVAWSQTALYGDITDWYAEELTLDAEGRPASSLFQGEQRALVGIDESYVIANVPILGSIGRTETWTRYETFDGRPITQIEGRLAIDDPPGPGEVEINVLGERIVPGDVDGDGRITAISVDHAAFDDGNLMLASDGFGHATDVRSFREATRRNVAYSQNLVVADADGSILYTGYQPVPCRKYLDRQPDGSWADGANPQLLLDGTRYRGFSIPVNPDGTVDESHADDPYRCVVPFDVYPQNLDPEQGYVLTANNDIGNLATDGSLTNDDWYIGGPWVDGYRAKRIDERLAAVASTKTADIAAMSDIQADHRSMVGEMFLPPLLAALDEAERVAGNNPAPGSSAERMAAIWT
ncbi:MAG: penicillin acylase family protein, partial [Myxococcales bacterium]|nr:penicillin acylase family protein [Myxococcales bacterium]